MRYSALSSAVFPDSFFPTSAVSDRMLNSVESSMHLKFSTRADSRIMVDGAPGPSARCSLTGGNCQGTVARRPRSVCRGDAVNMGKGGRIRAVRRP